MKRYRIKYIKEDKSIMAWTPDYEGIVGVGPTKEEVRKQLHGLVEIHHEIETKEKRKKK